MKWIKSSGKYTIPDDWPFADARDLFFEPDVRKADDPQCDFKWDKPDIEGLVTFLVTEKGFSEDRVRSGGARLEKNLKSSQQARLEGFFKVVSSNQSRPQILHLAWKPATLCRFSYTPGKLSLHVGSRQTDTDIDP